MLTHILLHCLEQPWAILWLRESFTKRYVTVETDDQDRLLFCFKDGSERVWDVGRIIKTLRSSAVASTTELLYRLACLYDSAQETSAALTVGVEHLLGVRSEPTLWYWSDRFSGLYTEASLSGDCAPTEHVQILAGSAGAQRIVLHKKSEWLRALLLKHLQARAVKQESVS